MNAAIATFLSEITDTATVPSEFSPQRFSTGLSIPALLPDELADTYFDLIATANDYRHRHECVSQLSRINPELKTLPVVVLLARICSMPVVDLVRYHTLTPFQRAFVLAKSAHFPHGTDIGGHLRHGTMRSPRKSLFLCKCCADEDRRFWGRSYWRRTHQIPGIEWCDKHELPLYECERAQLQLEPFSYLGSAKKTTNSPYPKSGIVRRYIDLATFVMALAKPIPVSVLQHVVRAALKGTGIRSSDRGKRPLLSDYAVEMSPREWLDRLIPRIYSKEPNHRFHSIDNAVRGAGPIQAGAILALALLHKDTDECANLLLSRIAEESGVTTPRRPPQLPNGFWSSEKPLNLYLKHGADESLIALELGLNRSHVQRMLRTLGLPTGNLIRRPTIRIALREFLAGDSVESVVSRHKLSTSKFHDLFRYNLYAIRPLLQ